jgi:8-oxo-dGTP pyrophosphatase MutT (NUDIX family)
MACASASAGAFGRVSSYDAWPALAAARRSEVARVPFFIERDRVGSVAAEHLDALRAWPQWLDVEATGVQLIAPDRNGALSIINGSLRMQGLIVAWRDETYPVLPHAGATPLALIERASARFWGTLTFGAHANGFVTDAHGRPSHLWIARRAMHKATDPGKLDNLVGGGVPHGQTPFETLVREGFEEAGLDADTMHRAVPGGVIELACDIAEGFMHEELHCFDLRLPAGLTPSNQDGEVADFRLLAVQEAIAMAAGDAMTVDAALVTIDFALRHRLLTAMDHEALSVRIAPLVASR